MILTFAMVKRYTHRMSRRVFVFALLFYAVSSSSFASELLFLTHSSQGQTFILDEELRGQPHAGRRAFYVELIRAMMLERGVEPVILNVPLARGMREVQTKDDIAFFNVTRTAEREDSVNWIVELLSTSSYFFELENNPTGILTLEDAKKVPVIGVLRGGIHESKLKSLGFNNLYAMESYSQVLSMLKKGRIDLTASSRDFSTQQEQTNQWEGVRNTQVKISDSVGYLCFSKNVNKHVVEEWQSAFDKLSQQGTLEALKTQYLYPELASSR